MASLSLTVPSEYAGLGTWICRDAGAALRLVQQPQSIQPTTASSTGLAVSLARNLEASAAPSSPKRARPRVASRQSSRAPQGKTGALCFGFNDGQLLREASIVKSAPVLPRQAPPQVAPEAADAGGAGTGGTGSAECTSPPQPGNTMNFAASVVPDRAPTALIGLPTIRQVAFPST